MSDQPKPQSDSICQGPKPSHEWTHVGSVLLTAIAVTIVGTLAVDASRTLLILIPVSFLVASYGASTFVERLAGPVLQEAAYPQMLELAIKVGVGTALLALLAVLSAMSGVFWIAGIVTSFFVVFGLVKILRNALDFYPPPRLWPSAVGGIVMGTVWMIAWLWGTIPPIFYDELVYHLVIPQRTLTAGELPAYPWLFFTYMPCTSDVLLAWGLALGGELGARAMHLSFWVACSLAAWGVAERIAWPRPASWVGPMLAGALASSPTIWFLGVLPFTETSLTLAILTALGVLITSSDARRPWLAFGLLCGLAAGVKLSGLLWVAAAMAAALVLRWPLRDLVRSGLVVLASVAPWWIRALVHTGNPIYPMAYGWLGGRYWSEASQMKLNGDLHGTVDDLGPVGLLRLPVDLIVNPHRFGSASDAGILAVVAACSLVVWPVITRLARLGTRERQWSDAVTIFTLVTATGWILTSVTTRFFAPALSLGLAVLVGYALLLPRKAQMVILLCLLWLGIWGTSRFLAQHSMVFSSDRIALAQESAEEYLSGQLDHYEAARYVRDHVSNEALLLFIGETRPYYFSRNSVAPYPFTEHPLTQWVRESSSPETLKDRLILEGITHVVLNTHEFKRVHDHYGVLAFNGPTGPELDHRLKALPRTLSLLFKKNGVYVFAVPAKS